MRCLAWIGVVLAACLAAPELAHADADVDAGWRSYLEADFDGALAAFARAERGTLTRAELVSLLEGRAQVHLATGSGAELDATLVALASLAPSHRLAPESPPELVERFAATRRRVGRGIGVDLEASRDGGRLRLVATVHDDPAGLARSVRIAARIQGVERSAFDEPLELDVAADVTVEYWAEVIGPAHAVVASAADPGNPERSGPPRSDDTWLWVGVGAGGAAVLAAIVVGVVLATQPPPLTQPGVPTLPSP